MSRQTWREALIAAQSDSTAHGNSTTAVTILPAAARKTLLANEMDIGRVFKVTAMGRISNIVTTPGTILFGVRLGPTSNIVVFSSGAIQLSTTAHTNVPWWFEVYLTCRAIGSGTSANLMGQGKAHSQAFSATAVADSTTTHGGLLVPNTAPAVGAGFDSTVQNIWDLFATFSIADAGNTITTHQFIVESLN